MELKNKKTNDGNYAFVWERAARDLVAIQEFVMATNSSEKDYDLAEVEQDAIREK